MPTVEWQGLQAQSHRKINRFDILGQRPNRHIVHARLGNCTQGVFVYPARGFQFGLALGEGDGLAHFVQAQFVQHDDVGPGIQCLAQFFQAFYFNFHRLARGNLVSSSHGLGDAATGGDVVSLNNEGVIQADAVIVSAALGDGVFLRQA